VLDNIDENWEAVKAYGLGGGAGFCYRSGLNGFFNRRAEAQIKAHPEITLIGQPHLKRCNIICNWRYKLWPICGIGNI